MKTIKIKRIDNKRVYRKNKDNRRSIESNLKAHYQIQTSKYLRKMKKKFKRGSIRSAE